MSLLFFSKSNLKEEEYCSVSIMKVVEFVLKSHAGIVFKVRMTVITLGLNVVNAVYKTKKEIKLASLLK